MERRGTYSSSASTLLRPSPSESEGSRGSSSSRPPPPWPSSAALLPASACGGPSAYGRQRRRPGGSCSVASTEPEAPYANPGPALFHFPYLFYLRVGVFAFGGQLHCVRRVLLPPILLPGAGGGC